MTSTVGHNENTYDGTTDYDEDGVNIRTVLRRDFGRRLRATLSERAISNRRTITQRPDR
ncbi:MAG: hypothetical protein R3E12_01335 [Candidatus Eisenbacteria bacterium]